MARYVQSLFLSSDTIVKSSLQCTPQELAILLPAFNKIGTAFDQEDFTGPQDVGFKSPLLNQIIFSLPKVKEPVQGIIKDVHLKTAAEGKKESLWTDFEKYPEISDTYLVRSLFLLP